MKCQSQNYISFDKNISELKKILDDDNTDNELNLGVTSVFITLNKNTISNEK